MRGPALLLACLIAAAIVAPVIAPYPPDRLDLAHRREAPSIAHLFGTDDLGRDVLGARAVRRARLARRSACCRLPSPRPRASPWAAWRDTRAARSTRF